MQDLLTKIKESSAYLIRHGFEASSIGIVLGTGLGSLINEIKIEKCISYNEIPHFQPATVELSLGVDLRLH